LRRPIHKIVIQSAGSNRTIRWLRKENISLISSVLGSFHPSDSGSRATESMFLCIPAQVRTV